MALLIGKGRRVLITRPEPQAICTARQIEQAGFLPILLPLSEIIPIQAKIPSYCFEAIVVTSSNAIRYTDPSLFVPYLHMPLYAIGARTAHAARSVGFRQIIIGNGDSKALLEKMIETFLGNGPILYFTGKRRLSDFEEQAFYKRLHVIPCETYDTIAIHYSQKILQRRLGHEQIDSVLLYSVFAATRFVEIAQQITPRILSETRLFCFSQRILNTLPGEWKRHGLVAQKPDEDSLLALLASV